MTIVSCADGCDLAEMVPNSNLDGGSSAGPRHRCGNTTKLNENVPLLRFDWSAEVDNGDTITEGLLRIYVNGYAESGVEIPDFTWYFRKCLREYLTDEATYNSWKSGSSWTTPGARSTGNDFTPANHVFNNGPDRGSMPYWWEIDITAMVQAEQGNGQNLEILIHGPGDLIVQDAYCYWEFHSYLTPEANAPDLVITHEAGPPGASRNWGAAIGSRLGGIGLADLPRGWRRRPDLGGLVLAAR